MSRKVARELCFKVIFSYDFQDEEKDWEPLLNSLKEEVGNVSNEDDDYIKSVLEGVYSHKSELDSIINKYLKGWTMDRISKTDLAILRLATYEIMYRDDIPYKVSVNEALELSKVFSDDTSASFINGVLAGVINEVNK